MRNLIEDCKGLHIHSRVLWRNSNISLLTFELFSQVPIKVDLIHNAANMSLMLLGNVTSRIIFLIIGGRGERGMCGNLDKVLKRFKDSEEKMRSPLFCKEKKTQKRLFWLVVTQAAWTPDKSFGFIYWSWQGQVILKSFGLFHDRIMELLKEGCVM